MSNHEANQGRQHEPPLTGGAVLLRTDADRLKEEEAEERSQQRSHRSSQLTFNKILAFATVVTAGLVGYQGWVMRSQLDAAKDSATAAKDTATTARETLYETLTQMDRQSRASRINAETAEASRKESAANSKAAIDASIQMARDDQRAWVAPVEITSPGYTVAGRRVFVAAGSSPRIGVTITNTGKTPALKFTNRVGIQSFPRGVSFSPVYRPTAGEIMSMSVLLPNAKMTVYSGQLIAPVDDKALEALKSGDIVLYVFGRLHYDDVAHVAHTTTFCLYLASNLEEFNACDSYNSAD